MTQREKVLASVSEVIRNFGLKTVRMDDVANSLGMSKRTLYEMFGDKEELLYDSICYMMNERMQSLSSVLEACDSILEKLLVSVRELFNDDPRGRIAHRLMFNLKKFYPSIYERVQRRHSEQGMLGLRCVLDECRAKGYLDRNVDVELMAQLFLLNMSVLMSEEKVVLPEGVSRDKAVAVSIINFLRGLASVEGLRKIDEILARENGTEQMSVKQI